MYDPLSLSSSWCSWRLEDLDRCGWILDFGETQISRCEMDRLGWADESEAFLFLGVKHTSECIALASLPMGSFIGSSSRGFSNLDLELRRGVVRLSGILAVGERLDWLEQTDDSQHSVLSGGVSKLLLPADFFATTKDSERYHFFGAAQFLA